MHVWRKEFRNISPEATDELYYFFFFFFFFCLLCLGGLHYAEVADLQLLHA